MRNCKYIYIVAGSSMQSMSAPSPTTVACLCSTGCTSFGT